MEKNFTLHSQKSPVEILSRLKLMCYEQEKFSYQHVCEESEIPRIFRFYGHIGEADFKISPVVYGKSNYSPIIEGKISESSAGSITDIVVRRGTRARIIDLGVLIFALIMLLPLMSNFFSAVSGDSWNRFGLSAFGIVLLLIFYLMNRQRREAAVKKFHSEQLPYLKSIF